MSRTIKAYRPRMCMRSQRNRPHKVEQALLQELEADFCINLGNRAKLKAPPEPWDDKPVAALSETKHVWKHDRLPRPKQRWREA